MSQHKPKPTPWSRYGFFWVTSTLFVASLVGHWWFAWATFVDEQAQAGMPLEARAFLHEVLRDTLENWQSEFLQLVWQVSGLTLLYHIGSPQSKDGNDRLEEKVDLILRAVDTDATAKISHLDDVYQRD